MKKLSLFGLVAVLAVGLLSVGAFAAEESDTTHVSWNYTCNAQIVAHEPIEEGEVSPNQSNDIDLGTANVDTSSNCGYNVSVKATSVDTPIGIGGGGALDNFHMQFTSKTNGDWGSDYSAGSGNNLGIDSSGTSYEFGEVPVSSAVSSNWDYWTVNYLFDADGAPAGEYQVNLTYTLSTTD